MDCIYLAAGLGNRLKQKTPKQFSTLMGKPVLIHALEILEQTDMIDAIYVTCHHDFMDNYQRAIENYNISKCQLIGGGNSRQDSVKKALQFVNTEKVLIHEAARPFITSDFVISLTEYDEKAIVPTIPISFTVAQGEDYMEGVLNRNVLHNIQLPQLFHTEVLINAHEKAVSDNFQATEDSMLVFRLGEKVRFVPGIENNIKVTTPLDLIVAENLFKNVEL